MGQISQIRGHLPELSIRQVPGRHARVPDSVLDVVEELSVAHILHWGAAQIRRARILAAPDFGLTAAVIRVANLAALAVYPMSRLYIGACGFTLNRIVHRPKTRRHR